MRRKLIVLVIALFMLTHAAPADAYALKPYRWTASSVTYYLDYTVTDHSSWPGYIAQYSAKWKAAESASPTLVRGYNGSLAPIYVYQGRLADATSCGHTETNFSGSSINYTSIGYSDTHGYGINGSTSTTCDLPQTTMHEFGHALGLDHSYSGTVMYKMVAALHNLTGDDINGIQMRY